MKTLVLPFWLIFFLPFNLQSQCPDPCPEKPNTNAHCEDGTINCDGETRCVNSNCYYTCTADSVSVWTDCNNDRNLPGGDGCEVDRANDPMNCGGCDIVCDLAPVSNSYGDLHVRLVDCRGGRCFYECEEGWSDCDDDLNLRSRTRPWTGCECPQQPNTIDIVCNSYTLLGGTIVCEQECETGYYDCNGDLEFRVPGDGCEVNLKNDVNNCGACMDTCLVRPNAVVQCIDSTCVYRCMTGFADCDEDLNVPQDSLSNGCESDTLNNVLTCGGCNACSYEPPPNMELTGCINGLCNYACKDGYENCDSLLSNGCETRLGIDFTRCESCEPCPPQVGKMLVGCLVECQYCSNRVNARLLGVVLNPNPDLTTNGEPICTYVCQIVGNKIFLDCDKDVNLPQSPSQGGSVSNGCECHIDIATGFTDCPQDCVNKILEPAFSLEGQLQGGIYNALNEIIAAGIFGGAGNHTVLSSSDIILNDNFVVGGDFYLTVAARNSVDISDGTFEAESIAEIVAPTIAIKPGTEILNGATVSISTALFGGSGAIPSASAEPEIPEFIRANELNVDQTATLSFGSMENAIPETLVAGTAPSIKGFSNRLPADTHFNGLPAGSPKNQGFSAEPESETDSFSSSASIIAGVLVSPNPFQEDLRVEYKLRHSARIKITLYDAMGRQVGLIHEKVQEAGRYIVNINLPGLAAGMYILNIESGNQISREKIVKI